MSCGRGDDTLVEHDPDLRGERGERPLAHLIRGARRRRRPRTAPRTSGSTLGAPPSHRYTPDLPASTSRRALSLTANRSGNAACIVSRDVQGDGRPDQREQRHRAHRQPERLERPVGLLDRRALVDGG